MNGVIPISGCDVLSNREIEPQQSQRQQEASKIVELGRLHEVLEMVKLPHQNHDNDYGSHA